MTMTKLNLFSKSFIFMTMWSQMWIRRFLGIHYIMHMCWSLSFSIFYDIYSNYLMDSLIIFDIKASLASRSRVPGFSRPWENRLRLLSIGHRVTMAITYLATQCLFLLSNKYYKHNNAMHRSIGKHHALWHDHKPG